MQLSSDVETGLVGIPRKDQVVRDLNVIKWMKKSSKVMLFLADSMAFLFCFSVESSCPFLLKRYVLFTGAFFMVYIYIKSFDWSLVVIWKVCFKARGCISGRILPVLWFSSLHPVSSVGLDSLDIEMMNWNK